jgi:hypothetical protein
MPHLRQGNTKLACMSVKVGGHDGDNGATPLAAVLNNLPLPLCGALTGEPCAGYGTGQGVNEEDTTGQDTSSRAAAAWQALHFTMTQSPCDEHYSVAPPRTAAWELVEPSTA